MCVVQVFDRFTKEYFSCLPLGWIGCQLVEAPFVTIGEIHPFVFFLFFAITPILGKVGR